MASLSKDSSGNRTIQFMAADGKRRSIRLGKMNAKHAESLKLKVETIAASVASKLPLDSETAAWLGSIGDELSSKLAAVGLIPERQSQTIGAFLDAYLAQRRGDSKPSTISNISRVIYDLKTMYGSEMVIRDMTAEKAELLKTGYLSRTKKLAAATVHRHLKMARMLFGHAVKLKLIAVNPFAEVKAKNGNPSERQQFVSIDDTEKLIAAANPTWQTIIALARYGGLRCPSEVLLLRWEHVDFANDRMTVTSPKTEHHEGRAYRVVPIFAHLRPFLEDAHELALPGEVYVVGGKQGETYRAASQGKHGWVNCNLRTTFLKIIRRAGLVQWPRIFQNLRASRETELMQYHAIHVVTAWMGNTPKVALGHYLQTLESDFAKAVRGSDVGGANSGAVVVQNAVQTQADRSSLQKTKSMESPENMATCRVMSNHVNYSTIKHILPAGIEPTATGL